MSIAGHRIITETEQRMKRIDQMIDLVGANKHLKVLFEPFRILLVKTVQDQFDFASQLVVLEGLGHCVTMNTSQPLGIPFIKLNLLALWL